jgi:hypothetical protein
MRRRLVASVALVLAVAACSSSDPSPPAAAPPPPPAGASTTTPGPVTVPVHYRVEVRARGVADFPAVVEATLDDPRGWERAGFDLQRRDDGPFLIVVAEGPEVDALCHPYETGGRFSCQLGPVVAINADRWRTATPQWTGDLATYRQMLVNHEVGHLLGQKHRRCPGAGPAPVMEQQSTNLGRCRPNPWPLDEEIERAARDDLPLAPPYERD